MGQLDLPKFNDDEQYVVKEVTILTGFVAAVGKLIQLFYGKNDSSRPRKKSKEERLKEVEDVVRTLSVTLPAIQDIIKEVKEDNGWVMKQLTQVVGLISEMRQDARQTRATVDSILLMNQDGGRKSAVIRDELEKHREVELQAIAEVKQSADRAYAEANTVNQKIEHIGMQMKDKLPLNKEGQVG